MKKPEEQSQKLLKRSGRVLLSIFPIFLIFPFIFALSALQPVWADDNDAAAADVSPAGSPDASAGAESSPVDSQSSPAAPGTKTIEQQRLDIMRFGTETEIANLIQLLKNEKVSYLDKDLIDIAQNTRNRNILAGIFSFFADMEKKGLEERAIRAINERDQEANETVLAAVDYLGRVRAAGAKDCLEELINSGESRFMNSAFRALGRCAKSQTDDGNADSTANSTADSTAFYLLDYYNNRNPGDENKREIITALGETGSKEAVSFLTALVKDSEERAVLRMAALDAISKIGDSGGLDAVIEAVSSTDPNVRSSAIAALGPFTGEAAENAILEGFRDSYYRSRIGAAQAAGKRKLVSAVPFLRFRAENDDVPTVRDEAIRALGAINNDEAMTILDSLFSNQKNTDRVRVLSADMLMQNNAGAYSSRIVAEMDDAKNKKQTALYNGYIRILGTAKSDKLEDFARRLIVNGGVIEKSLALDLILNNEFRGMADDIRPLLDEKKSGASLARKAKNTMDKLGLQ